MLAAVRYRFLILALFAGGASIARNAHQAAPLRLQLTSKELSAILFLRNRAELRSPAEPPVPVPSECKAVPWIATVAAVAVASKAAATSVDAGNFNWLFKKPEDRKIADFLAVHPPPGEQPSTGSAAEESTLHP